MSKQMDEAMKFLADASNVFNKYVTELSKNSGQEDFAQLNEMYRTAAKLSVLASQFSTQKYEGPCQIDNQTASVWIDGFQVRDKILFEVLLDGKWQMGYRENSQYGQVFIPEGGSSCILTSEMMGRVQCPLKMAK